MENFNRPGKRWRNIIIFGSLLAVSLVVGFNFYQSWSRTKAVNQEISQLQENIKTLEQGNQEFQELIKYFNSDAYIEERARLDLGLKKQGENVTVVSKNNQLTAMTQTTARADTQNQKKKCKQNSFYVPKLLVAPTLNPVAT